MKNIEKLRKDIDKINAQIVKLLAERMRIAEEIAQYKKANNLPVYVPEREKQVIKNVKALAKKNDLDEKFVEKIFWKIIGYTRNAEIKKIHKLE